MHTCIDSQKLDAILRYVVHVYYGSACFCPEIGSEAISEHLLKNFLGEHTPDCCKSFMLMPHIYTSDTYITPPSENPGHGPVTPIEACSLVKIILKMERVVTCLATMAYVYAACTVRLLFLVLLVNSDRFQILWSYTLLL